MKGAGKVKRSGRRHDGTCDQVVFGSDDRFTRCTICETARYYPDGYKGEVAWIKVSKQKKWSSGSQQLGVTSQSTQQPSSTLSKQ